MQKTKKNPDQRTYVFEEENKLHGCAKEIKYIIKGECWICTSHHFRERPDDKGFFCLHRNGKQTQIHRYIWQKANQRKLEPGEVITRTCKSPRCISASHMKKTKRAGYYRRKLTSEQASKIRSEHSNGVSQMKLAIRFNVSQSTISNIIRNKTYLEKTEIKIAA